MARNIPRDDSAVFADLEDAYIPEPNSGCWLWLRTVTTHGYGQMRFRGEKWGSHRVSFVSHKGEIPDGKLVLHKCDNPLCINPDHLYAGTNEDNDRDRVARNRQAKGERIGCSKLTPRDVLAIRQSDHSHRALSRKYGVSVSSIGRIRQRLAWGWLS